MFSTLYCILGVIPTLLKRYLSIGNYTVDQFDTASEVPR